MVRRAHRTLGPVLGICWAVYSCAGHSDTTANGGNTGASGGAGGKTGKGGSSGASGLGAHAGSTQGGSSGANDGAAAGDAGAPGSGAGAGGNPTGGIGGSPGGTSDDSVSGAGTGPRGCDSPSAWSSNLVGCAGDYVHRPNDDACVLSPRELDAQAGAGGQAGSGPYCATDADCAARPDGYCLEAFQSHPACVYSCRTDADCANDELCACDSSRNRPSSSASITVGVCVPAACRTDADCAESQLCIAPLEGDCAQDSVGKPKAFHCQSPDDECSGRGDCAAAAGEDDPRFISYEFSCRYAVSSERYVCGSPDGC